LKGFVDFHELQETERQNLDSVKYMILLLHLIALLYCRVITWYYPLALKVFRMGMGPLQWIRPIPAVEIRDFPSVA